MRHTHLRLKLTIIALFAAGGLIGATSAVGERAARTSGSGPIAITPFQPKIPRGIPADMWQMLIPADNPLTAEKVALGRDLFFDKRLSLDQTVSCATCHDPATAFADRNVVAIGIQNRKTARNSPTMLNAMFNELQFWDGRAPSLEEQSKLPMINSLEMGMKDHDQVIARVREIPEYQRQFAAVFGGEGITIDTIAKAIASFERTQLSGDSPFDRFIAGDQRAISASAKRGWELFNGQARCITCHAFNESAPFFSDFKFHNTGVAAKDQNFEALARRALQITAADPRGAELVDELALSPGFSELGRYLVTKEQRDIGSFKTSMLRDIELTAPYMHNGSEKTLRDVMVFYNRGGDKNPNLDGGMRPLKLTDAQIDDVVELMKTFTGDDVRRQVESVKPQTRAPFSAAARGK